MHPTPRLVALLSFALLLPVAAGHAKERKKETSYVFFPPPPDEARIQFLASFSSEEEFAELAGKRSFFNFVVGEEKIQRPIVKPYGIATAPDKIFVCDTLPGVVEVVDMAKKRFSYFKPTGDATLGVPINIAVDADGTRYITDTKRDQVVIYKQDAYAGAIGEKDEMKPGGVALTKDRIYVSDIKNGLIRVYDKGSLKPLFTFPKARGGIDPSGLFQPTNLAIDPKGRVWVSDSAGFFVNVYEADGRYVRTVGEMGLSPGTFSLTKGIAVDREGRAYVVDANTQIVQLFDGEGRILMYFGDPSSSSGGAMSLPAGITLDYDNTKYFQRFAAPGFQVEYLILVTNQTGGFKVSVFGFGRKK